MKKLILLTLLFSYPLHGAEAARTPEKLHHPFSDEFFVSPEKGSESPGSVTKVPGSSQPRRRPSEPRAVSLARQAAAVVKLEKRKLRTSSAASASVGARVQERFPHTIQRQANYIVFPSVEAPYKPLVHQALTTLEANSTIKGFVSEFPIFFRDFKTTTSHGNTLISNSPGNLVLTMSRGPLAKLATPLLHQRPASETHNGRPFRPLFGHIYESSIRYPERVQNLQAYRVKEERQVEAYLFYDGGNTLWMKNTRGELKFLVGESLIRLNESLLEKAGRIPKAEAPAKATLLRELVLRLMAVDLETDKRNIIVIPQEPFDYHIDFAFLEGCDGNLLMKDPKAGSGALLVGRRVSLNSDVYGSEQKGTISGYNQGTGLYEVQLETRIRSLTVALPLARDLFSIEDPHSVTRQRVKELLEYHHFHVHPTPMVFPREHHCVYLTNSISWRARDTGTYHLMLFGTEDIALRSAWAEHVRTHAFPGRSADIHFIGNDHFLIQRTPGGLKIRLNLAQHYMRENQAGLHCMTFEDDNQPLRLILRKKIQRAGAR